MTAAATPATALAAALDVAIALAHEHIDTGFEIECATADFLRDHGPALAAALKVLDAAIAWRQCSDGYHNRNTDKLVDAIDAALSARVDDTPTRGTPR